MALGTRLRSLLTVDSRPWTEERQAFWRRVTVVIAALWLIDAARYLATEAWVAGILNLVVGVVLLLGNRRFWAWSAERAEKRFR